MEYIKCNVPAVHLEARLISRGKRVGILWPQDTFTTVQHYRNVPLENRPWLFHTQKFLVLYKCTWWLISHKCTRKFNAWPSAYLGTHTWKCSCGWMDGWFRREKERHRWYLYLNVDLYTCTTLRPTLNSSYRNSEYKKMVWDSEYYAYPE